MSKTQLKDTNLLFKANWIWPERVEAFMISKIEGECLHVCCGTSKIGNVRLDILPQDDGVIEGDMFDLPFPDNYFQTVICDPPWHIPYHKRWPLLWELRRVVRWNGILIFNCLWVPPIKGMKIEETWISMSQEVMVNVNIIVIYRKIQSQL